MSSLNSEAIRSQPAVVAFYAGKFLAERSIFTQAAQVLQLAYQEVLRVSFTPPFFQKTET